MGNSSDPRKLETMTDVADVLENEPFFIPFSELTDDSEQLKTYIEKVSLELAAAKLQLDSANVDITEYDQTEMELDSMRKNTRDFRERHGLNEDS